MLKAVVVLPSPGCPLVTSTVLGGPPAVESMIEVLSIRYASAAAQTDCVEWTLTSLSEWSLSCSTALPISFSIVACIIFFTHWLLHGFIGRRVLAGGGPPF